jgi:hypothetical protein
MQFKTEIVLPSNAFLTHKLQTIFDPKENASAAFRLLKVVTCCLARPANAITPVLPLMLYTNVSYAVSQTLQFIWCQ